jgi:hypothetical protein
MPPPKVVALATPSISEKATLSAIATMTLARMTPTPSSANFRHEPRRLGWIEAAITSGPVITIT